MTHTIRLNADIPPDRQVHLTLPPDVPVGPAELEVVVTSQEEAPIATLGDLLHSEFFGMWRDRADIADSAAYARQLRDEAWRRSA